MARTPSRARAASTPTSSTAPGGNEIFAATASGGRAGRTSAVKSVVVQPRAEGHLTKVNFEDGVYVEKGDLLFEIDLRPYKAALDQAEAQVASAEASLKLENAVLARTWTLVPKGAASREELDVAIGKQAVAAADVVKAKANAEDAALNLAYTGLLRLPLAAASARPRSPKATSC